MQSWAIPAHDHHNEQLNSKLKTTKQITLLYKINKITKETKIQKINPSVFLFLFFLDWSATVLYMRASDSLFTGATPPQTDL